MDVVIDFPGLAIGVAEDTDGTTGCTVLVFDDPVALATDVRGGRPGVIGADYRGTKAICLAGGSLLGLEATAGVTAELWEQGGRRTGFGEILPVAGAVIFDWRRRTTLTYPDVAMGRAALRSASPGRLPCGRRGAGCSATYNKLVPEVDVAYSGGQGGVSAVLHDLGGVRVAVVTVINAVGNVIGHDGAPVVGAVAPPPRDARSLDEGNTTISVVATDARLSGFELRQWGRQVHTAMARAIHPFHTTRDGDVLFAVTTGASAQRPDVDRLGTHTSELLWDAIITAVTADA